MGSSNTPRRPNYGYPEWQQSRSQNYGSQNPNDRRGQRPPHRRPSNDHYHSERGSIGGAWTQQSNHSADANSWNQRESAWDRRENNLGADNYWKEDPKGANHANQQYEAPRPKWESASYRPGPQNYDNANPHEHKKVPSFAEVPQRNAVVAGLLAIFLGAFGVHNFYTGRYKIALIQLGLTVLSSFSLAILVGLWGVVEGLLHLVGSNPWYQQDGWGRPLAR